MSAPIIYVNVRAYTNRVMWEIAGYRVGDVRPRAGYTRSEVLAALEDEMARVSALADARSFHEDEVVQYGTE